jgi:hypothetical protein
VLDVDQDGEITPGGSAVFRHRAKARDLEPAAGEPGRIRDIEDHIARHVGEVETVYHEIVSDLVHLDVAMVPATPERPFQTLVTMGMSERPMRLPDQMRKAGVAARAELVVLLPPEWPATDPEHHWPLGTLKFIARATHQYDTWLGVWHTIPNGDPPRPYAADTALAGAMVAPSIRLPQEFGTLARRNGETIAFMAVVYLTADEVTYKLEHGAESLFALLDAAGASELLDASRPSVVPTRASRRGRFRFRRDR